MSWRPKWQNFGARDWDEIRASWLNNVPKFPAIGAAPDPGLEELAPLQAVTVPNNRDRLPDVDGLRTNALWEAVFLFHKCAHTNLAAQRLGQQGMQSWSLFNAYHSAYLGARGVMTLLGMALPRIGGVQVAIDLFPQPAGKNRTRGVGLPQFNDFVIVRLDKLLEQRYLWEGFQRMLNMSQSKCWDLSLRQNLLELSYEEFSRPRNHYLYKAHFWPLSDLAVDAAVSDFNRLFGSELDVDEDGFLLRLCFSVYRIFEQLISDLGSYSEVIKEQLEGSRILTNTGLPVLESYVEFVAQVSSAGTV